MSVSDLSGLSGQPSRGNDPDVRTRGRVSRAPTAFTDDLVVTPEGSSQTWPIQVRHGRWWPHPDGTLPQLDDPCLVLYDDKTAEPWVWVGTP